MEKPYSASTRTRWFRLPANPNARRAVVVTAAAVFAASLYWLTTVFIESHVEPWAAARGGLTWAPQYGPPVALRIADSVRYELRSDVGRAEFAASLPSGGHLVYIAPQTPSQNSSSPPEPEKHTVTLFHQIRCLDVIRQAYTKIPSPAPEDMLHHCMNYLRQTILCRPHMLLEPVTTSLGLVSDYGYDAVCEDWEAIYREAERNHEAYTEYRRTAER